MINAVIQMTIQRSSSWAINFIRGGLCAFIIECSNGGDRTNPVVVLSKNSINVILVKTQQIETSVCDCAWQWKQFWLRKNALRISQLHGGWTSPPHPPSMEECSNDRRETDLLVLLHSAQADQTLEIYLTPVIYIGRICLTTTTMIKLEIGAWMLRLH